jgi:hypothetical protein
MDEPQWARVGLLQMAYVNGLIDVLELENLLEAVIWHDRPIPIWAVAAAYGKDLRG